MNTRFVLSSFQWLVCVALAASGCNFKSFTRVNVRTSTSLVPVATITSSRPQASAIFGQASMTANVGHQLGLVSPQSPVIYGTKLVIADPGNHRVLIWNMIPTSPSQAPDVIVGQTQSYLTQVNGNVNDPNDAVQAAGLDTATGVCVTSTGKLIVSDKNNHRILIWNSIPTTNGTAANVVLGQPNFTSNTANNGGVSAQSLNTPMELECSGTRLYVSDYANHRVLFWNSVPTNNHTPADGVLGQPDLDSNTVNNGGRSASTMNSPRGLAVVGARFLVADSSNHRVLVWSSATPASLAPADTALGQSAMNLASVNSGGLSGHSMSQPIGVGTYGAGVAVAEAGNHRILVWNGFPGAWTTDADFAIGQPDLDSNTLNNGGVSESRLSTPTGFAISGTDLVVADTNNHRILIFNSLPNGNSPLADAVWGQPSFSLNRIGGGGSPTTTTNRPFGVFYDQSNYWVTDSRHNRVLRFPLGHDPFDGSTPDLTLGQASLATSANALSDSGFFGPNYGASNGIYYYVLDSGYHRILIWTSAPSASGQAADGVLGQASMVGGNANAGGLSATSLSTPYGIAISGTKLIIADYGNNRVLIWNTLPTAQGDAPNVVLGQPDFDSNTANNGGVSEFSMSSPSCVLTYGNRLFVCDRVNHRILVWDNIPTVTNTPADYVIGQPDFASNSKHAGVGSVNAGGLNNPISIAYQGEKFFVADYGNNRVLSWDVLPEGGVSSADTVYGQFDFTSSTRNAGGLSNGSLFGATQIYLQGDDLWIVDNGNNRLLRFDDAD